MALFLKGIVFIIFVVFFNSISTLPSSSSKHDSIKNKGVSFLDFVT